MSMFKNHKTKKVVLVSVISVLCAVMLCVTAFAWTLYYREPSVHDNHFTEYLSCSDPVYTYYDDTQCIGTAIRNFYCLSCYCTYAQRWEMIGNHYWGAIKDSNGKVIGRFCQYCHCEESVD